MLLAADGRFKMPASWKPCSLLGCGPKKAVCSGHRADDSGEILTPWRIGDKSLLPCGLVQGHKTCAGEEDARFLFVGLVSAVTEWCMTSSTNQGEG